MAQLNLQIANGADDTRYDGGDFSSSEVYVNAPGIASWGSEKHLSFRFTGVSGLSGATITSATLEIYAYGIQGSGCQLRIYADDSAAPTAPTTAGEFTGKTLTTAYVDWDSDPVTGDFNQSPDIKTVIQELANSYNPSAIQLFVKNDHTNDSANHFWQTLSYDYGVSAAANLYITYTPAASGASGSLSATLGELTLSASGTIAIKGALDTTLGAVTLVSAGTIAVNGTSSVTLGALTSVAAGVVAVKGAVNQTLGAATLSAAGVVADQPSIIGTLTATLAAATLSATGTVSNAPIYGEVTSTLAAVTGVAAGKVVVSGGVNSTLDTIALSAAGTIAVKGATTSTLSAVTLQAAGAVAIRGLLAGTLDAATLQAVIFLGVITTPEARIYKPGAHAPHSQSSLNRVYVPAAHVNNSPEGASRIFKPAILDRTDE